MQFKITDISQPKKKRKTGGSFCAVGGCSNNSYRDLESAIDGRGFLKFYRLPKDTQRRDKWVARMRRQFGWKPSKHTKICSDNFHESDFITTDLNKYRENQNLTEKKRHMIRLKNDATPNTKRYVKSILSQRRTATQALLKRFQSRKINKPNHIKTLKVLP